MSNIEKTTVILSTCPDRETAESIAKKLVSERSAACINLIENIHSIYRWQNGIESDRETLLIIKSRKQHYKRIEQVIQQLHPYEIPEIISLDINQGADSYLRWISESTDRTQPTTP